MNRLPNIVFLFAGDIVRHAVVTALLLAGAVSVFAAGPPEPTPPPSAYKIGALHWPLYTQGTHFGWEVIDRDTWSNRRPLLDMYDEDSPEVWAWFNYWAQNYGITYWIMGVRMRESYPANEPYTSGLDAWMKSKYAERMEFCICFHGGSASERRLWLVNHALRDKRYLKHEGKVVVLCFDGDTNGLRAELNKAGFPSLVFGGGSSEGNFSYLGGWGRGSGMATVSHGFDDRPWGRSSVRGMKSPAEYLAACKKAKDWMDSLQVGAFGKTHASLNCWNEIGEGHFIQPSTFGGFGLLDAARQVFTSAGSKPNDLVPADLDEGNFNKRYTSLGLYYRFDDSAGNPRDSSPHGHHGAIHGDPVWRATGGRIGGALEFDGDGDYVQIAGSGKDGSFHDFIMCRTVMMWFKADTTRGTQVLYDEGGSRDGFCLRIHDGMLEGALAGGAKRSIVSTTLTDTSSWHHVALAYAVDYNIGGVVHDAANKKQSKSQILELYLDGELVSSKHGAPGAAANEDPAGVGARVGQDAFGGTDTGAFFKGRIDEVMVSFKYLAQFQANLIQGYADLGGLGRHAEDFSGKTNNCAPQWWLQKKGEWRIAEDGGNKVFAHAKTIVTDARTEYQGFFNDATLAVRVKVNDIDAARGRVGVIVRSLEDAWIEAGYDHATDTWEIRQTQRGSTRLLAGSRGTLNVGAYAQWVLTAEGGSVALKVDGATMVSTKDCAVKRHGMFGFYQSRAGVCYDDVVIQ